MVLVDVQVALDLERHVDQRVAAELFDHVVEEADPGGDVICAGPVEADLDENAGFRRVPLDPSGAHGAALYARA